MGTRLTDRRTGFKPPDEIVWTVVPATDEGRAIRGAALDLGSAVVTVVLGRVADAVRPSASSPGLSGRPGRGAALLGRSDPVADPSRRPSAPATDALRRSPARRRRPSVPSDVEFRGIRRSEVGASACQPTKRW